MAAIRLNIRDKETNELVTSGKTTEYAKVDAMIRRLAERKGWDYKAFNDYLDSGKTAWINSEDGKLLYEVYLTND